MVRELQPGPHSMRKRSPGGGDRHSRKWGQQAVRVGDWGLCAGKIRKEEGGWGWGERLECAKDPRLQLLSHLKRFKN